MAVKENQENSEENEKNNKSQKSSKKFEDLKWGWAINEFIDWQAAYDLSKINDEFLDEKTKLFFSKDSSKKEEFDKLDIEEQKKIKEAFSKSLETVYISKKEIVSNLEKTFSDNYDLSLEQKKKLSEWLKELKLDNSWNDLKKLSIFKSFQEDFLVKLWFFKNRSDISKSLELGKLLEEIFWNKEIEFKSKEEQDLFHKKLFEFEETSKIKSDDIKIILSIIPIKNKDTFIKYFISKISLEDLKEDKFLSEEKADEIKENIIKKYKENWKNINIKKEDLDESLIFIDHNFIVNELFSSKNIEDLIAKEVAKEMNQLKKDTINHSKENSILNKLKLDSEGKINNSFIDYVHQNSLPWISNIQNLQNWSFIVFETKRADWTIHKMIQKVEEVDVWWNDLDSKKIKLSNYTSDYWVLKEASKTKELFYENFYEFLQIPWQAAWSWEKVSIDFLTKEDYEHYLKWEIKVDWKYKKERDEISQVEKDRNSKKTEEDEKLYDVQDLAILKEKIDIINPDWREKSITEKWKTTFVVWKPGNKDFWHFSIRNIDEATKRITLSSKNYKTWTYETLSFKDFLIAFEQKEAKRWDFIWAREPFMIEFFKMKAFDGKFELKDGKLIEKVEKWEKARNLEYLTNSKWEAIKIEEFWFDYVSICTWDLKEKKSKDWKSTNRTFNLSYPQRISYEDFYNYLNDVSSEKEAWNPFLEEKKNKPDEIKDANRKMSIWKKLMSFYCVADIVTGLKMLPTWIEDYLKQGSSIRSAKFALALGQYLPDDVRLQLQSKVESEQKKTVEWLVDKRITLDSTEFIPKIDKIIQNASSEDYEVEAALMAILKKYWKLYRWDLAKHSGTFIWYRALGWKPNDALYRDTKENYEKAWKPFTEEALIEELLKIQSTPVYADWKLNWKRATYGITRKRRSKFGKDYGWYVKSWVKEELEDGKNKTEWMLSTDSVIWYAMWEFSKLAHNNWLWAMDVVWQKWWTAKQMNMLPHIITSSWLSQSLWDSTLKWLFDKSLSKPYPALSFCKTKEDIQIYRNVCRKLIDKMWVSSEDKALFAKSIDDSKTEQDRIKASAEFYKKHWEELVKKLSINQDPVIFLEKDSDPDFKKYYTKLHELYNLDGSWFSVDKWALRDWFYNYENSSLFMFWWDLWWWIAFDKLWFWINDQTFNVNNEWRIILIQFAKAYKDIANLKISEEDKKKIFKYYYTTIETTVRKKYWSKFKQAIESKSISALHNTLKSDLWIDLYENAVDKNYHKTNDYDNFLNKQWEKYTGLYIDKNIDIKTKTDSKLTKAKEEKRKVEDDVFKILKWEKKATDFKKEEKTEKEKSDDDIVLNNEKVQGKQKKHPNKNKKI